MNLDMELLKSIPVNDETRKEISDYIAKAYENDKESMGKLVMFYNHCAEGLMSLGETGAMSAARILLERAQYWMSEYEK